MRRRKARDMRKRWLQPRHYREFLAEAMAQEGRDNSEHPRPIDQFSRACAQNFHGQCHGWIDVDYTKRGPIPDREQCICHCHDDLA